MKALVEAGAQVDMHTKSTKGKNKEAVALHYAAQQNRHDIVEYLIKQKASINIQDARGCTPLHYAVYTGGLASCVASCVLFLALRPCASLTYAPSNACGWDGGRVS